MLRHFALIAVLVFLSSAGAAAQTDGRLADFDQFVARSMQDWKVPGMAIAIIDHGQVIWSRGYGMRDRKKALPVTPRTLFAIGSATKSFTVAALAVQVAQGRLDWDKPVRDYLPYFRLYDEVATAHLTPRDMVTHRSGLPRHDFSWYNDEDTTRAQLVERLRYLQPSKDFRAVWQYNNLMFLTAGYLLEQLSGTTWEETVCRCLFVPLGMNRSNFSVKESQKSDDYALPYQKDAQDKVQEIAFRPLDVMGPAGSINSNVEDMSQYVLMHMSGGKHGDRQILAEADTQQMQTPQMVVPSPLRYPEIGHSSYGMGFLITTYRGHKVVQHGGNIDGFSALVSFMPQDGVGMVILTNLNGTPYPPVLSYAVYDRLLQLPPIKWSERIMQRDLKDRAAEEDAKKLGYTPRRSATRPSHDLAEYVGEYENPAYGVVQIEAAGKEFKITYHHFSSVLKHFHYDVFEVPADPLNRLERTRVMFHSDWNGDISSLSIPFEPEVSDIVFVRRAARLDKNLLQTLAGKYELGSRVITVYLRGDDTLMLAVPGQPVYELAGVRGTTFDIRGLSGCRVEFHRDARGTVTEIVFYQPDGTFVAPRSRQ